MYGASTDLENNLYIIHVCSLHYHFSRGANANAKCGVAGGCRQNHRRDLSDRDIGAAGAGGGKEEDGRKTDRSNRYLCPRRRHVPIFNERRKHDNRGGAHLRTLFVILLLIFGCANLTLGSVWSGLTPGQHMRFNITF